MITIKNNTGWATQVHGTRARAYMTIARAATGKTRWCKTIESTIRACAYASLRTALMSGADLRVVCVEDRDRRDITVNIPLTGSLADMVQTVETACTSHGSQF
jgi:hypothetical protein